MLEFLFCLVLISFGAAVGSLLTRIVSRRKAAYGYFVLNPIEDADNPNMFTVGFKFTDEVLIDTKKLIFYKHGKSQE